MHVWQWLTENFMNGELFFYLIPLFLLVILVIVIFLPDAPEEEEKKSIPDGKEPAPEPEPTVTAEKESSFPPSEDVSDKEEPADIPLVASAPEISAPHAESVETAIIKEPEKGLEATPQPVVAESAPRSFHDGLEKTRGGFLARLKGIFSASAVTDETIEEMEEILYTADIGVATVSFLIGELRKNKGTLSTGEAVREFLKKEIFKILSSVEKEFVLRDDAPMVLLMVGVNGAGKTTTIGKLSRKFSDSGKMVTLAAGDTFRAAAVEQLSAWGERSGAEVISDREGADPASVAYNAVTSAAAKGRAVAIIDTAGRLQNRQNLMDELRKIHRVIGKAKEGAPHETILVIDANNGQNAVSQAREFGEAIPITGIIVTKLDGTAKGGALIGIARELALPLYFAGVGESVADLKPFHAAEFTEALFS